VADYRVLAHQYWLLQFALVWMLVVVLAALMDHRLVMLLPVECFHWLQDMARNRLVQQLEPEWEHDDASSRRGFWLH